MSSETVFTAAKAAQRAGNEERSINNAEQTIVELQDGARLAGVFSGLDANNGILALWISGEQQARTIHLDTVKIVHLPVLPQWIKAELLSRAADRGLKPALEQQDFRLEFKDGDTLTDRTLGFRADRNGLYFLPTHDSYQSLCIFVPHCVIRAYSMGVNAGAAAYKGFPDTAGMQAAPETQGTQICILSHRYPRDQVVDNPDKLARALERQRKMPDVKLGEVLVRERLITEEQLNAALQLKRQKQNQNIKQPLGEVLVEQKIISTEDLQYALAIKLGFPIVDLENFEIDYEAVKRVPENLVRKYGIVPLCVFADSLVVAVENPMASAYALDTVAFHTGMRVEATVAMRAEIERVIDLTYAMDDPDSLSLEDFKLAQAYENDRLAEYEASDNVVVRLVNRLISNANSKGASDIHIEPDAHGAKALVRIRKDGTLIPF